MRPRLFHTLFTEFEHDPNDKTFSKLIEKRQLQVEALKAEAIDLFGPSIVSGYDELHKEDIRYLWLGEAEYYLRAKDLYVQLESRMAVLLKAMDTAKREIALFTIPDAVNHSDLVEKYTHYKERVKAGDLPLIYMRYAHTQMALKDVKINGNNWDAYASGFAMVQKQHDLQGRFASPGKRRSPDDKRKSYHSIDADTSMTMSGSNDAAQKTVIRAPIKQRILRPRHWVLAFTIGILVGLIVGLSLYFGGAALPDGVKLSLKLIADIAAGSGFFAGVLTSGITYVELKKGVAPLTFTYLADSAMRAKPASEGESQSKGLSFVRPGHRLRHNIASMEITSGATPSTPAQPGIQQTLRDPSL